MQPNTLSMARLERRPPPSRAASKVVCSLNDCNSSASVLLFPAARDAATFAHSARPPRDLPAHKNRMPCNELLHNLFRPHRDSFIACIFLTQP